MFQEFQMINMIFESHDPTNAPSTYYQSKEGRMVDGMWGTPGLQATQSGYLRPEEFAGNHSLLWIDVSYHSALGHNPPRPRTPEARRLQLYNNNVSSGTCADMKRASWNYSFPKGNSNWKRILLVRSE
jgi:hypothetical protein